jgi:hypothetical protein
LRGLGPAVTESMKFIPRILSGKVASFCREMAEFGSDL